jgi:UPF0716 protein FxsA
MNVAKWLLLAIVGLPLAELAVFIAVAATIGFAWALMLVLATSLAGALVLRLAGGSHIARIRGALNQGSFTMLQADGAGAATLLAGILLLIPGFITDLAGVLLLIGPVRRWLAAAFGGTAPPARNDGVLDLPPEQWRRVPDPALPERHGEDDKR